jgi:hypothetical protein
MRAAVKAGAGDPGCVPNLKDLPAQIGRILKKEKAGLDRLDAGWDRNRWRGSLVLSHLRCGPGQRHVYLKSPPTPVSDRAVLLEK